MSATTAANASHAERGGSGRLWFGVLTGPVCWSLQILIGYNLEEIACNPGSTSQTIAGLGIEQATVALTLILGAVTLAAGLVAYGCLRRADAHGDSSTGGRQRWMAGAGIATSALFGFWIFAALFTTGYLIPCDPPL